MEVGAKCRKDRRPRSIGLNLAPRTSCEGYTAFTEGSFRESSLPGAEERGGGGGASWFRECTKNRRRSPSS